nr:reverse transcriptase domain-containing protein [Tanacetum cinerariifolium]
MSFEISFTDALILMPKFTSTLKALIGNKEKLSKMARTTMNEHCLAVILNKLPRKLGDPGKFLIPCEFSEMDECLALADLGASINLMPLSVWEGLSLPKLTPTCMTLELADRSVSKLIGIAKDVSFKVGVFHFPADFEVVDFEPDPRVLLILGRCFLKTSRALIDVHKGELTLRIGNEAITYNLDQTVRYSANYNQMTANKIDVVESVCKEYSQEEADAFLGLEDDPDSPKINPFYYNPDGDILLLEAILNSKPSPPLPNQEQNLPSFKEELKAYEAQTVTSSVDEPPEVELKDLPHHLEYSFLEGDNNEEKAALIKVLKSHKRAIAWKLSDIQVSKPISIAIDVSFKVGVFHFPADFVVVDFEPDPRVPLILGRCFLKTSRAFIVVHKGELTLRIRNEAITYNLDQTVRYSANYNQMTANKIDVVESECEEYAQKGDNKLPVIIAKELRSEEKIALIKVLKSHKRAIA